MRIPHFIILTTVFCLCALCGRSAEVGAVTGKVVARTGFDGPYYKAGKGDLIQKKRETSSMWTRLRATAKHRQSITVV